MFNLYLFYLIYTISTIDIKSTINLYKYIFQTIKYSNITKIIINIY